jgi:RNA polymerase sigma factor FliA
VLFLTDRIYGNAILIFWNAPHFRAPDRVEAEREITMVDGSNLCTAPPEVPIQPVKLGPQSDLSEPDSMNEFLMGYQPLVESIARRMYGSLPPNTLLELHDLTQSGLLGLVNAGRCYDPTTTVSFSTYARYRIEGEILDTLRRNDHVSRRMRRWQKQVSAARQQLAAELNRKPTEEELCDRLMVSLGELRTGDLAWTGATTFGSHAAPDQDLSSLPANSPSTDPDHICSQRQLRAVLDRLIESLPPRYQQVIQLYYRQHKTVKDIGVALCVKESRASQIHRSALRAMAKTLRDSGISSSAYL